MDLRRLWSGSVPDGNTRPGLDPGPLALGTEVPGQARDGTASPCKAEPELIGGGPAQSSDGRSSLNMRQPEIIELMMDWRDMMSSRTAT